MRAGGIRQYFYAGPAHLLQIRGRGLRPSAQFQYCLELSLMMWTRLRRLALRRRRLGMRSTGRLRATLKERIAGQVSARFKRNQQRGRDFPSFMPVPALYGRYD